MARRKTYADLHVYLNGYLVGRLSKQLNGAVVFTYDPAWADRPDAIPVSLSLHLRPEPHRGPEVAAFFDNLLPDQPAIRRRVAERIGAPGTDAYGLLSRIGRDCVGALQFFDDDTPPSSLDRIEGEPVSDDDIATMLKNLGQTPLGLQGDDDFRISIAGAQEKTALLFHEGQWLKPTGTTPTTHILKTQIGHLPNGINLSNSVENEFYCLNLAQAFGLDVNHAEMMVFSGTKALVVRRFDRKRLNNGWLIRLPQEDFCQLTGTPPTLKYQSEGGPGIVEILDALKGSDDPGRDHRDFLMAQMLFWIIGATDGHAKNFSVFLAPGGRFRMTPLYDILTAQPSLDHRQGERRQMKFAMSVGQNRHYRLDQIQPRHFAQTAEKAGIPPLIFKTALQQLVERGGSAFDAAAAGLPEDFPPDIHDSVLRAARPRLDACASFLDQLS